MKQIIFLPFSESVGIKILKDGKMQLSGRFQVEHHAFNKVVNKQP